MNEAETLLAQALAAVNTGEYATAADRFERAAAILTTTRPTDAVSALESAARLRLMADDPRRAEAAVARATRLGTGSPTLARVRAEVEDRIGDAASRRAAWLEVTELGGPSDRQAAHIQLAGLAREANEHALAASHFEAALELVAPGDDPAMVPELWLEISIARSSGQDPDGAEAAAAKAEAAVAPGDDQGFLPRITGQRGVIALIRGDAAKAMQLAEAAREGAVARNDVMTYLSAASLVALIHEQAERLVDAYDTYVRARESLGQLLGPQGKELVQPAIQLFEERLGAEKFKTVWDAWVAKRRAAQPS